MKHSCEFSARTQTLPPCFIFLFFFLSFFLSPSSENKIQSWCLLFLQCAVLLLLPLAARWPDGVSPGAHSAFAHMHADTHTRVKMKQSAAAVQISDTLASRVVTACCARKRLTSADKPGRTCKHCRDTHTHPHTHSPTGLFGKVGITHSSLC